MDRAENRADPQTGRDMERLVRAHDWSATPLGPRESWPQSLRTTVDLILAHDVAMAVLWGPDLIQIYNDAYTAIAAGKHPAGFGRPNRVSWPELWRFHAPIFDAVRNGETRSFEGRHLRIARHGQLEDAWFDLCFSPVRDERGAVGGILVTVVEKTKQVRAQAERARSQRLFESIADATPGILCVFDLCDGRMVYSNRSIEQILGYAPGQRATFAAVVDEALLHPEDKPRVLADLAGMGAIGPGETREHEFRMRHADGRYRWLHARYAAFSRAADGRPEQILYLAEDVTARRQAEDALRMSEERFRAFFDAAPQIMWVLGTDGAVREFNERWTEVTGLPRRRGADWLAAIHPEDRPRLEALRAQAIGAGTEYQMELRLRRADGAWRWHLGRVVPMTDDGTITGWLGSAVDIHERKEAEAALRASEARLRLEREFLETLIRQAPVGISIAEGADGRTATLNDKAFALLGHRPEGEDLRRYEGFGAVHADGRPYAVEDYPTVRALRHGEVTEQEDMIYRRGSAGSPTLLAVSSAPVRDASGQVVAAVTVFTDVEEQRRIETALRHQLELNRTITEHAADALFLMDPEGRITFANPAAERMFGWGRDELQGRPLHETLHHHRPDGTVYPREECPLMGALRTADVFQDHEAVFFCKNGRMVPVICSNAPITEDGRVTGAVMTVHDITERKRAEKHRQLLLAELSHRVKNTLAAVQSIARQTSLTAASPEAFQESLTARLMALSQAHNLLSRSDWQGAGLHDVVLAEVSPYAGGQAGRVSLDGPGLRLPPRAALSLGMAFHELATNAAKYGALSVATGRVEVSWTIDDGECLLLRWAETEGPPVAPPRRRGFGSSLIERGIAHELDGEVRLEFRPDGVRCTMRLPLAAVRTPAGAAP